MISMRGVQVVHAVSTLALSWLLMMAFHEFGHVLHAWVSGGRVTAVILHPLSISRTDVNPNPHPQFVVWGGAMWGTALPLMGLIIVRRFAPRCAYLARFFAGFCCVANGTYLAAGSLAVVGDAADLLRHGVPSWILVVLGIPLSGFGLYLWHGLGKYFGLGREAGVVDRKVTIAIVIALLAVVVTESTFACTLTCGSMSNFTRRVALTSLIGGRAI